MATFHSLEEAKEFFKGDRYAAMSGMQIDELSEDGCVCSMELNENHQNAYGGIMGGVTFTLGDFALAVTANQVHTLSVAQQVSINYLNAPKGKRLIANAKCIKSGRTTSIIHIMISDETGREVALFVGTAFKLQKKA